MSLSSELNRREFIRLSLSGVAAMAACRPVVRRNELDDCFIAEQKRRIEEAILPLMARLYDHDEEGIPSWFRPQHKLIERVVSYYDYYATGLSVLAPLAHRGNPHAQRLVDKVENNMQVYLQRYFRTQIEEYFWETPLRRLLLHIALAYPYLQPELDQKRRQKYRDLVTQQVELAIAHVDHFLPGRTDLWIPYANNHTAIFMQGIYYCGRVFERPDWVDLTLEFAERYYRSGHPDGYWEEHTNAEREGGPSLLYTRLTAGCLYDVLNGKEKRQQKFIRAGDFYRSFINYTYNKIPIADERSNNDGKGIEYGLALHSLTPRGRGFIVDNLPALDLSTMRTESLAVLYHELDLMVTGDTAVPENRQEGSVRISLPLGVIRKNRFTAALSALKALNHLERPESDYALDQQNMVYLSHWDRGVILSGIKSKNRVEYSTFRIGDDAYCVRTGELEMGEAWAEAHLYYATFEAWIRWEIGDRARLILRSNTDRPVTTGLTIVNPAFMQTDFKYRLVHLPGFSPYTAENRSDAVASVQFSWVGKAVVDFVLPDGEE
ncbi:hypothetical protein JW992_10960 [candidate division KSB1 bacterium]|nr:hypothetical protein [candidate division KSB1 bacterium]